jgi:hypothetical protein
MLGLGVDDLGVGLAVGNERGELLDDRRLRRDRVHRHDIRVDLAHRVRNGFAAGEQLRCLSLHSATISIAFTGQISAQISQPLQ